MDTSPPPPGAIRSWTSSATRRSSSCGRCVGRDRAGAGGCWPSSRRSTRARARRTGSRWRSSARRGPTARSAPGQTVVELTSGNTGTGPGDRLPGAGAPVRRRDLAGQLGRAGPADDRAGGRGRRRRPGARRRSRARSRATTWRGSRSGRAESWPSATRSAPTSSRARPTSWRTSGTPGPRSGSNRAARVDVFLDLVGTGGTFTGVARALRRRNPALRAYVVEPEGAAVLAGRPVTEPAAQAPGGRLRPRRPAPARPHPGDRLPPGERRRGHRRRAVPRGRGGDLRRLLHRRPPRRRLAAPRRPRGRRHASPSSSATAA